MEVIVDTAPITISPAPFEVLRWWAVSWAIVYVMGWLMLGVLDVVVVAIDYLCFNYWSVPLPDVMLTRVPRKIRLKRSYVLSRGFLALQYLREYVTYPAVESPPPKAKKHEPPPPDALTTEAINDMYRVFIEEGHVAPQFHVEEDTQDPTAVFRISCNPSERWYDALPKAITTDATEINADSAALLIGLLLWWASPEYKLSLFGILRLMALVTLLPFHRSATLNNPNWYVILTISFGTTWLYQPEWIFGVPPNVPIVPVLMKTVTFGLICSFIRVPLGLDGTSHTEYADYPSLIVFHILSLVVASILEIVRVVTVAYTVLILAYIVLFIHQPTWYTQKNITSQLMRNSWTLSLASISTLTLVAEFPWFYIFQSYNIDFVRMIEATPWDVVCTSTGRCSLKSFFHHMPHIKYTILASIPTHSTSALGAACVCVVIALLVWLRGKYCVVDGPTQGISKSSELIMDGTIATVTLLDSTFVSGSMFTPGLIAAYILGGYVYTVMSNGDVTQYLEATHSAARLSNEDLKVEAKKEQSLAPLIRASADARQYLCELLEEEPIRDSEPYPRGYEVLGSRLPRHLIMNYLPQVESLTRYCPLEALDEFYIRLGLYLDAEIVLLRARTRHTPPRKDPLHRKRRKALPPNDFFDVRRWGLKYLEGGGIRPSAISPLLRVSGARFLAGSIRGTDFSAWSFGSLWAAEKEVLKDMLPRAKTVQPGIPVCFIGKSPKPAASVGLEPVCACFGGQRMPVTHVPKDDEEVPKWKRCLLKWTKGWDPMEIFWLSVDKSFVPPGMRLVLPMALKPLVMYLTYRLICSCAASTILASLHGYLEQVYGLLLEGHSASEIVSRLGRFSLSSSVVTSKGMANIFSGVGVVTYKWLWVQIK